MSFLKRLRKQVNYEPSVPRCDTCAHHRQGGQFHLDGAPFPKPAICAKHGFTIQPIGLCDHWMQKWTGEQLEG